jgi:hypothetical protein
MPNQRKQRTIDVHQDAVERFTDRRSICTHQNLRVGKLLQSIQGVCDTWGIALTRLDSNDEMLEDGEQRPDLRVPQRITLRALHHPRIHCARRKPDRRRSRTQQHVCFERFIDVDRRAGTHDLHKCREGRGRCERRIHEDGKLLVTIRSLDMDGGLRAIASRWELAVDRGRREVGCC